MHGHLAGAADRRIANTIMPRLALLARLDLLTRGCLLLLGEQFQGNGRGVGLFEIIANQNDVGIQRSICALHPEVVGEGIVCLRLVNFEPDDRGSVGGSKNAEVNRAITIEHTQICA